MIFSIMKYNWYAIKLVIITIIVFVLQFLIPGLTDEFALVSSEFFSRPWTIITSIFLHGGVEHLLYNMLALALFGSVLEKIIGGRKFLILYFASGIVSGFGSILFYRASIGASGAIFGVMGTLAILRPRMSVWLTYAPMPMALAVVLWIIGNFVGLFAPGEVAYAAHLFGLGFGLLYGFVHRKEYGEVPVKSKKYSIGYNYLKEIFSFFLQVLHNF